MNDKVYKFTAVIQKVEGIDGAYVEIPFDVREEFGKGRVKVTATFDGVAYVVCLDKLGVPLFFFGIIKDIRAKIVKRPGDAIEVTIRERI